MGLTSSGRTFNLRRLGALLRLADELDNSYLRVQGITGQEQSPRQLIRDINPLPAKGIIEIHAEPQSWSDWKQLIRVKDYTQKRLREIQPWLEQLGLSYYQVWLRPERFSAPFAIGDSRTTYDSLVEYIGILLEP